MAVLQGAWFLVSKEPLCIRVALFMSNPYKVMFV
jgi:hypothetical protein